MLHGVVCRDDNFYVIRDLEEPEWPKEIGFRTKCKHSIAILERNGYTCEKTISDQNADFQSPQFSSVLNKVILDRQHADAREISKSLKRNWLRAWRWRTV